MAQRQTTLIYDIDITPGPSGITVDAYTGLFVVSLTKKAINPMVSSMPGGGLGSERLTVNKDTMKYVNTAGQPKWDVSQIVVDGTPAEALAAVKSDMAAAIAAGTFDL